MEDLKASAKVKNKLPPVPGIKRVSGFRRPKVEIVIACEGRNTEPSYLKDCIDEYGAGLVRLRVIQEYGVPLTVVKAAVEEREKLIFKRRRSASSFDACFRVWAVFDRDEHPGVPEALQLAAENGIDVAFSNPCFELWPLLHLEDYGAQDHRHALQARLEDKMPKYNHENGALIDFPLIKNNFALAYSRADKHRMARLAEGEQYGSPFTSVGDLVKKIIENGKCAFRK